MDLITTHVNADFDGLSSLVAAKKLYPDSRLLLPGSQEKSVRDFLALCKDQVVVEYEKGCNLDGIDRLVLVDTRHKWRIGIAGELVDRGVEVHIFDHHPRMKGDVVADKDVYEEVGATVTILADIIRRKRIKLSYLEATVMLLGIYEETGSLTYRTTTKFDVDMVSFLLAQGANLSVVSKYLNRELSEDELSFLARLIGATERVIVNGVSISMVELDASGFRGEMGMLIHKLVDVENIPVLFAFIRMNEHRVNILARSKLPNVDVNKILGHFGGGGHISAAFAKVETDDTAALKEDLIKVLRSNIRVRIYAKDIMSQHIKSVSINDTLNDVKPVLEKDAVSSLPVIEKGKVVGIVSLTDVNKVIRSGYGHARVKGYMSRNVVAVKPETPLHALQKLISEKDIGVLPVLRGNKVLGIINRTDILRNVYAGLFAKPMAVKKRVAVNLSKKMNRMLPRDITRLLKKIGELSNELGHSAFLVGGVVRDLLLGTKNLDLDIVVEGSAIELGKVLAGKLKGTLVVHKRFGTCTVVTKAHLKIDLATARKETYEKPAALPTVEFSSLKDDLIRRDFTINAMALSLNSASFGQLIDFFGGQSDLLHGRIKVMHDASFIDDPTRIFRAVRFEQRFGFTIDAHTQDLIRHAIREEMFDKTQAQRIRDEIVLILNEASPLKAIKRMAELHELRFIHHNMVFDQSLVRLFHAIDAAHEWYMKAPFRKRPVEKWLIYLMALCDSLNYAQLTSLCDKFVFRRIETERLLSCKKSGGKTVKALARGRALKPSQVYAHLIQLSCEEIIFIMAKSDLKVARSRIKDFFQKYQRVHLEIRGSDIKSLGLKPGPVFKRILDKVLCMKIDGLLRTKQDELKAARKYIAL